MEAGFHCRCQVSIFKVFVDFIFAPPPRSGKDDSVLIIKSEKVEGGEEGEKEYTLQIKLTKDISENNHHLFIGEWKCGDDSWIVKGSRWGGNEGLDDRTTLPITVVLF